MTRNIFQNIPSEAPKEIFETLLEKKNVKIERIISNGQKTPAGQWYDQKLDEWVVLLQGSAALRYEGESSLVMLSPGDFVFIPAGKRHRVEFTDNTKQSLWLAFHF